MNIQAIGSVGWVLCIKRVRHHFKMGVLAKMFRKAGAARSVDVSVSRTRIRAGSGTISFPTVESCRELSLGLIVVRVAPQKSLLQPVAGRAVNRGTVAQIKVKSEP